MSNFSIKICLVIAVLFGSVGGAFASELPPCPLSGIFHNCFGTYTFNNGDKYVGEWRDDKRNGKGTDTYANGDKYVGESKDDKQNGQGTYTYADGNRYVGEFKDGKQNGQGTLTYANGNRYVGEYKDDKRTGQGTFTWVDGERYVGEFKDGKTNGQGVRTFADSSVYIGEERDGKKHGQGTYTFANGTIKEGIWKDDEFQYAKKLSPTVPVVKAPTQNDEIISASSGSGFAVSSDGYVITNHHVIEGCQKVVVHTKGKELPVTVVTYDPQNDLALLKGDFRPSTVFPLSNNRPELLQDVYVAGFPFGDKFSTSVKVTKGIVSSLTGLGNNFSNIQIDAALQSGNSGGPILDEFGNVVGVAVAKLDAKYMFEKFGIIPENTNFGIKSSVVRSVLDSNSVDSPSANRSSISKSQLGKMISNGTYYISCWMTMAQIEKMKAKKVFFSELE
jgi:S1-C subfamily serine protease